MTTPLVLGRPGPGADPRDAVVRQLRERMHGMAGGLPRLPLATPPELAGLLQLRTGGSYRVDDTALVLALLAAPSREGAWVAMVGVDDLGIEAAAEAGVDLDRTVVVPDAAEHWVEVVAALVDVLSVVWLRPAGRVTEGAAGRLSARLRKRTATLLVQGAWPGAEARLRVAASVWEGAGHGHGRLQGRRVQVACRRGTAPEEYAELRLPATGTAPVEVAAPRRRRTG
ncbi:MAG: hypothetical protein ACTHNS_08385 [Marmoricola sp.]